MVASKNVQQLVAAGVAFMSQGQHAKAEKSWREATILDPQCSSAWRYLTEYLALSKRIEEATVCLRQLTAISERTADSLYALADKWSFLKDYFEARRLLDEALRLEPPQQLWIHVTVLLAKIEFAENQWLSAVDRATRILDVDPNNTEALLVRQLCYFNLGWTQEDVTDCRRYLELKPDAERHNRLLFKLNCLASTTPELLYEEAQRWNSLYAAPLAPHIRPHQNTRDPGRSLKVGYLSPDFRHHAMMRLIPGVLENHDRQRFEVFAYSIDTKRDEATKQVEKAVDHFIELPPSRNEIAQRVRQDGIDVLVDLAGHTMLVDALLAFALKPAPVQLTWMGTLATTGLSGMDYFLGDSHMPCPGTEHLFTEQVYRLPRVHACYRPLFDVGVTSPPYFKNGHITFGSFNDPKKLGREVIKVWSVILHLHPGSKLFLKYGNLGHDMAQQRLREWFQEDGISAERLRFEGADAPLKFLHAINEVDIALDPFPYTGGTTTLETLWMGVPVVSIGGRLAVNQCGACLLATVGLPVANTLEQYIALAALMAKAIPEQPDSRRNLRETLKRSQLMDEVGMTRTLEAAYQEMWQRWCQGTTTRGLARGAGAPVDDSGC